MPLVGFGLWKVNNDTCADQVYNAIKTGYRLFDGAADYGNEVEAGQGVKRAIDEGLVKREELFIVSKLWNTFHDKERVGPICKKQLNDWGLDYFDLYIIHFPIALKYVDPSVKYPPGFFFEGDKIVLSKASLEETYHAMEELYDSGLIKSIGISNYTAALVLDVERYAKHMPQTLQIEHHPYLVQQELIDLCKNRGIQVTAYSSFGPQSFLEMNMQSAQDTPLLMEHNTVKSIADKHDKTPAQVLLRWSTQRDVAVIPKSNNQKRLAQNLDVCSFDLSNDEIKQISGLDKHLRFNNPVNVSLNSLDVRRVTWLTMETVWLSHSNLCIESRSLFHHRTSSAGYNESVESVRVQVQIRVQARGKALRVTDIAARNIEKDHGFQQVWRKARQRSA